MSSLFIGIILPILLFCLMTYLATRLYSQAEVTNLLSGQGQKKRSIKVLRLLEKATKFFPAKYSSSSKLALRNPFSLLLVLVSIYSFLVLVVMSFSLHLSSSHVYQLQTAARRYKYEVTFPEQRLDDKSSDNQYFFKTKAKLSVNSKQLGQQDLVALDEGPYFQLQTEDGIIQLRKDEVAINSRLAELYNLKAGDKFRIQTKDFTKTLTIKAIATNENTNSIYLERSYFNELNDQSATTYNGLWSQRLKTKSNEGQVETYEDYVKELQNANVSNRTSAVINQVLGVVFGSLLIFLVLLLNFQDNTMNFIYLCKLGYLPKEIKHMLTNIYLPLIVITFLVLIGPSIITVKQILKVLSLQTRDYLPFSTNLYVFVYAFLCLLVLYFLVLALFDLKLKALFRKTELGKRL